ncbi:hypothetical protein TSUD_214420 [Trifolium subterraneum]|uniref:Uncharacterized protein n=1 Tax=Trifolium subterraneum TaxID=3900 RepID=A0A2Z6NJY0_TRISU|nr:hypothetical protein TSUD_214420 [Trifolium subterraneum]
MHTIPRNSHVAANPLTTVEQIDQHWLQHKDRVLTSDMFGSRALLPSDTAPGYMKRYFKISHPYIFPFPAGYPVRMLESDDVV